MKCTELWILANVSCVAFYPLCLKIGSKHFMKYFKLIFVTSSEDKEKELMIWGGAAKKDVGHFLYQSAHRHAIRSNDTVQ